MPSKPARRRLRRDKTRRETVEDTLARLWDIGPHDRNEISLAQINRLRNLVDLEGGPRAAELVGISEVTLLRVCAGFGHRLRPATAAKVREHFGSKP